MLYKVAVLFGIFFIRGDERLIWLRRVVKGGGISWTCLSVGDCMEWLRLRDALGWPCGNMMS